MATLSIENLGLTPGQLAEARDAEPGLVEAWLEATAQTTGLRSPAAWFIAGVRSRQQPAGVDDGKRILLVRLAEARVANIGHVLPDEHELREEIFGRRALLEPWAGDAELVARMVSLWRQANRAPGIVWPRA